MVIQENKSWIIGCVDLKINTDYKNFEINKPKSTYSGKKKFYSSAKTIKCEFPIWAEPLIQNLPPGSEYSWSLQCVAPNTVIKTKSQPHNKHVHLLVFLENWQPGNYFELDNQPMVHWQSGTYVAWTGQLSMININFGNSSQYNLELIESS
jgi:hypothetical protein